MHDENKKQELGKTWKRKGKWKSWSNVKVEVNTSAAGLCHVKSVQPSLFSHTAWQSCTIQFHSHTESLTIHSHTYRIRHNHILTTRSNQIGKIMTPVWVAVGLRWIWWFLVCNLWLVSRLYLQPDMSACQSSCLSCPQFQKADESFSHPDVDL